MTVPRPGQTVQLMSWHDVLRVRAGDMQRMCAIDGAEVLYRAGASR
jgi:hypothetical protein